MWQTDRISDAYAILSDKNRYFADRTSRLLFNYSLFWFNIYTRPRSFWSNFWSLFIMAFCWPVLYWHLYMLLQFFQDLLEIAFVPSLILHFQFTFSIKIILLDKSNWSLYVEVSIYSTACEPDISLIQRTTQRVNWPDWCWLGKLQSYA